MKTILHVIDTTGPGGAETVFIDLLSGLDKSRYRSLVLIRGPGWVCDELKRRGFEPIILDAKGSFNWRYLLAIVKLIRSEKVDLIQSHLLGSNVYCALAGLIARCPVVATFHGAVDIASKERFMGAKFAAINLGASAIIAVSENLKRDIVERTPLRASKTRVIYNGVDIEAFQLPRSSELRQQHGLPDDCVIIGSLGNIRPAKGYDVLIRAAARIKDTRPEVRFVIAGQGRKGLSEQLEALRRELGVEEQVIFHGFAGDPAAFLANLDLFLLPSTSEGFSIATIQAMAAGLPVIVTRSGGPQEIVTHNDDGWMVEPGRPDEIADAVARLVSDPPLRQRLADQGRTRVESTFSLAAMLQAYYSLYETLLA